MRKLKHMIPVTLVLLLVLSVFNNSVLAQEFVPKIKKIAPEIKVPEATPEPALDNTALYEQVLEELNNDQYKFTYQYLLLGTGLQKGDKGDAAKGLQQLVNDLGGDITVEGNIGKKTMAALNDIQNGFALTATDIVQAEDFGQLLICALIAKDSLTARSLLPIEYSDRIDYAEAAFEAAKGNFYTAKGLFEALGDYGDSATRAQSCIQKWPKNGQIYRNSEYSSRKCSLTIKTGLEDDKASYIKIYTQDDILVSTVFIAGSSKATVKLPTGTYILKLGIGSTWYGPNESFGRENDAYYSRLRFENDDDSMTLKSNYSYTLTLQTTEEGNVGSSSEDWDNF